MRLENFAKMRALESAHVSTNGALVDHFLNGAQGDEIRENLKLKRLQFDTPETIYNEVEQICSLLECSKREFLQMAVTEALATAQETFFGTFKQTTGQEYGEHV